MESIKQMIIDNLPTIIDALMEKGAEVKIPLLNKSVNDLVAIKDQMLTVVERLRTEKVAKAQQLQAVFVKALGLAEDAIQIDLISEVAKQADGAANDRQMVPQAGAGVEGPVLSLQIRHWPPTGAHREDRCSSAVCPR